MEFTPLASRQAAVEILVSCLDKGQPLDEALARHAGFAGLDPRDRAFVRLLLATTLRRLGEIDVVLGTLIERPLEGPTAAGRQVLRDSTHQGRSNGLEGTVAGNDDCLQLTRKYPGEFVFGANEVSDLADAPAKILFLPRTDPLPEEPSMGIDRYIEAQGLAAEIVAHAAADGYTILQNTITQAVNVSLYRNLNYDLQRDFTAITQLATGPAVLVVHPSLPVKSVVELVKLARERPGELNYGSGGTGTYSFLAMELFKGQAAINILHIPYKGGGAALNAILAGETHVYFAPVGVALPNIQGRRMRALAVSSARRVSLTPDLPTLAEAGVAGYESGNWYGMVVPAKTPPAVVSVLRAATLSVLRNATTVKRMQDFGYVPVGNSADEFSAYIKLEVERLGKIVRAFKLQPD